jgi:hypothetical protein
MFMAYLVSANNILHYLADARIKVVKGRLTQ